MLASDHGSHTTLGSIVLSNKQESIFPVNDEISTIFSMQGFAVLDVNMPANVSPVLVLVNCNIVQVVVT